MVMSNIALKYAHNNGTTVSKCGNYVTNKNGKALSPYKDRNGYYRITVKLPVSLAPPNTARSVAIHRLKAYQMFKDDLFRKGVEVRHLNGIKTDNSDENISIGSHSDNMMDMDEFKRRKYAKNASNYGPYKGDAFWESVDKDRRSGMTYSSLSEKYNVSKGTLSYRYSKTAKRRSPYCY